MALDPQLVLANSQLSGALYGEEGQLAAEQGQASALSIESAGSAAEAGQYQTAAAIGQSNAQTEIISGQLQEFQNTRQLMNTLGSQQSGYAGAGFQQSGSALNVARSSLQQGLFQNQIIGTNANLTAGGYLEQAQSSVAEASAATAASSAEAAQAQAVTAQEAITGAQISSTKQFISQIPGGQSILNPAMTMGNPPLQPTQQGVHII